VAQGVLYGDYFLLGKLNRGGMAEVFLAKSHKPELAGKLLAVKRTLPELWNDKDFVSMFADEARIAKGLLHPNICQIYDQGESNQQLFIVMEFVHGKDLKVVHARARQRQELLPYHYSAFTIARIAEALDFAHHKTTAQGDPLGIVHRDVSPQNILLSYDGVPKLIDFGIAKSKNRLAQTQVGVLKGKFAYMSPEQAKGGAIDHRTDVFALGVVLYDLCTGKSAFRGSSDFSTLQRITQGRYTPVREFNPAIPKALVSIIDRALARDLEARYPTAMAMAQELDGFLAQEARPVNAELLSTYVRTLFSDDYRREITRIKHYLAIEPLSDKEGRLTGEERTVRTDELSDATGVAPSHALGAEAAEAGAEGVNPTKVDAPAHPRLEDLVPARPGDFEGTTTEENAQPSVMALLAEQGGAPPVDAVSPVEVATVLSSKDSKPLREPAPVLGGMPTKVDSSSQNRRRSIPAKRPTPPRPAVLSRAELLVLVLVAGLGAAFVTGAYFYARGSDPALVVGAPP
jgi:eukaryotic-like serine/threonine-protein kinase